MLIFTKEIFEKGRKANGVFSKKQFRHFGIKKSQEERLFKLIGRTYSEEHIKTFLKLRNSSIKSKKKKRFPRPYPTPIYKKREIKIIKKSKEKEENTSIDT